jgi:sec-independent protein translocase protein TatB
MFDIGWTEMLVIAVVMIVVVGPKDLPKMLRTFGKTTAKLRTMAGDFQKQFNEALKEAELDDVKKSVDQLRSLNPASEIKKQLNPFEKAAADVRAGLDAALKPKPATPSPAEPASAVAHAAEPLKNGATAIPGVAGPETMPAAPVMTPLNGAATNAQPAVAAAAQASAVAAAPVTEVKPVKQARAAPKKAAAAGPAGASARAANGKAVAETVPAGAKSRAPAASKAKAPAAPRSAAKKTRAGVA